MTHLYAVNNSGVPVKFTDNSGRPVYVANNSGRPVPVIDEAVPVIDEAWEQDKKYIESITSCVLNDPAKKSNIPLKRALAKVNSYAELCYFARHARAHLSFWGWRYITVDGYKGSLPLDALAARVLKLLIGNPHFDEEERRHGKKIALLIDQLYKQTYKFNRITYLMYRIRRYFPSIFCDKEACFLWKFAADQNKTDAHYGPIYIIYCNHNKGYNKVFDYYTKKQFKNTFKTTLNTIRNTASSDWFCATIYSATFTPNFFDKDCNDRWLPPSVPKKKSSTISFWQSESSNRRFR